MYYSPGDVTEMLAKVLDKQNSKTINKKVKGKVPWLVREFSERKEAPLS